MTRLRGRAAGVVIAWVVRLRPLLPGVPGEKHGPRVAMQEPKAVGVARGIGLLAAAFLSVGFCFGLLEGEFHFGLFQRECHVGGRGQLLHGGSPYSFVVVAKSPT